tara:strand:+ start:4587 stop:4883 length:297 start_codon:yes stop_codon:yes gene_type:complete
MACMMVRIFCPDQIVLNALLDVIKAHYFYFTLLVYPQRSCNSRFIPWRLFGRAIKYVTSFIAFIAISTAANAEHHSDAKSGKPERVVAIFADQCFRLS